MLEEFLQLTESELTSDYYSEEEIKKLKDPRETIPVLCDFIAAQKDGFSCLVTLEEDDKGMQETYQLTACKTSKGWAYQAKMVTPSAELFPLPDCARREQIIQYAHSMRSYDWLPLRHPR